VFKLTVPQRTRGADEYSDYLLSVGNGTLAETTFGTGREAETLVPLTGLQYDTDLRDLIDHIYPEEILRDPDAAAQRAILATLNVNVRAINDVILDSLPTRQHELLSYDEVDKDTDDGFYVDQDTLHEARGKGVPDHVLKLKIGAVCLITRNLNMDQGLVNGTKVIVEAISPRLVRVRKAGGTETYAIPRITFKFPIIAGSPMIMTRRQFPLQLAYAMSFHKSQGQTIDMVGIDLRTDCFTHGQLYVGLSRVRSPNDIRVLVQEDRVHDGVAYTKNIVYEDLLLDCPVQI
jgi:ATP-dependent DNA helicase PIF1